LSSSTASRELEETDDYSPSLLISSGIDFRVGEYEESSPSLSMCEPRLGPRGGGISTSLLFSSSLSLSKSLLPSQTKFLLPPPSGVVSRLQPGSESNLCFPFQTKDPSVLRLTLSQIQGMIIPLAPVHSQVSGQSPQGVGDSQPSYPPPESQLQSPEPLMVPYEQIQTTNPLMVPFRSRWKLTVML
jgi:hypothetical protein